MNQSIISNPIIISTHASDITGPAHYFKDFLIQQKRSLIFMSFPLSLADKNRPQFEVYIDGTIQEKGGSSFILPISFANYIKDIVLTITWTVKLTKKYHFANALFFGGNNLLTIAGLFLKAIKVVHKAIFYAIDYAEERYHNRILDGIYRGIDTFSARNADFVLSNTFRTIAVRKRQGVDEKRNIYTPNGAWTNTLPSNTRQNKENIDIIYFGALSIGKGLQYLIEAMGKINDSRLRLHIIGYGPYEETLRKLTTDYDLQTVTFYGTKTNKEIIQSLHKYDFSVNLITDAEGYLYYCDPLKIKESLANGVPVITSAVPEISEIVKNNKLGLVIQNPGNIDEIVGTLQGLIDNPETIQSFKQNLQKRKQEFTWEYIYTEMLRKIQDHE